MGSATLSTATSATEFASLAERLLPDTAAGAVSPAAADFLTNGFWLRFRPRLAGCFFPVLLATFPLSSAVSVSVACDRRRDLSCDCDAVLRPRFVVVEGSGVETVGSAARSR